MRSIWIGLVILPAVAITACNDSGSEAGDEGSDTGETGDGGDGDGDPVGCAKGSTWAMHVLADGPFDDRVHDLATRGDCSVVVGASVSVDLEGPEATDETSVGLVDASGVQRWRTVVARDESGPIYAAAADDGSVAFALCTRQPVELGGETLDPIGGPDLVVGKLSATGEPVWTRRFGAELNELCAGVGIDADGNVIVGGGYDQAFSFGGSDLPEPEDTDIFLAALSPDGDHLWSASHGGPQHDAIVDLDVHSSRIALVGKFRGEVELFGQLLPGTTQYGQGFIVQLDATGTLEWGLAVSESILGSDPRAVALAPAGGLVAVGNMPEKHNFAGTTLNGEAFIVSFDDAGAFRWGHGLAMENGTVPETVTVDADGHVYVGGRVAESLDLGGGDLYTPHEDDLANLFAVHYDDDGAHVWSATYGKGVAQAIAVDPLGSLYLGGEFVEVADFGEGPWDSGSTIFGDGFLVRLDPE